MAAITKELCDITYSVTVNADLSWWGGALKDKLNRAEFVVVHSRWVEKQVTQQLGSFLRNEVVYAPVGVDTDQWQPSAQRSRQNGWRVLSVSRLNAAKGHETLIRAIDHLVRKGHPASLDIVGEGPDRARLSQLITEKRLQTAVQLLGSQDSSYILGALHRADVFALATEAEALGVVFMEAMAAGVPVVGTDVGGVSELIKDGVTGCLVAPGDHIAIAEAIERLVGDCELRMRITANARKHICEHFDSKQGAARLYERLAKVAI